MAGLDFLLMPGLSWSRCWHHQARVDLNPSTSAALHLMQFPLSSGGYTSGSTMLRDASEPNRKEGKGVGLVGVGCSP
jgi:hypothetical protein